MKKTSCIKCLFAAPANSDQPCSNQIIQHLLHTKNKKISVVNDFYEIEDYECKMGFSKDILKSNEEILSVEDIKKTILSKNMVKIYLILDITNISVSNIKNLCDSINRLSMAPVFISFCLFTKDETNKQKIDIIRDTIKSSISWKTHVFLEDTEYTEAMHSIISSNHKNSKAHFILIYDVNNIEELDNDTNDINTICNIEQQHFHVMRKAGSNKDSYIGLLISPENYLTARRASSNIVEAINDTPEVIQYEYGLLQR